jgi:hypothetical protein
MIFFQIVFVTVLGFLTFFTAVAGAHCPHPLAIGLMLAQNSELLIKQAAGIITL